MNEKKRITVFTPTYNRGYVLYRLYDSLKKQTNLSFVWLIVDDGSTDNTEDLVKSWIIENVIEIRYFKQENGGKQRAHNKGVELADTELFICVDSDDYLTNDAIDVLLETWDSIKDKEYICGIVALRGKDTSTPIGSYMPKKIKTSTLSDLYYKYGFKGDTALLFRTDILKKFPFYVADGEKFMGERYVYLQIDQHYKLFLLNRILYICEYLEDGYSKNVRKVIKNNPKGYMILSHQSVRLSKSLKLKYLSSIKYMVGCLLCREAHPIKNAPNKILAVLAFPPALLYYILRFR